MRILKLIFLVAIISLSVISFTSCMKSDTESGEEQEVPEPSGSLVVSGKTYYVFPMSTQAEFIQSFESCSIRITLSTALEKVHDIASLRFFYDNAGVPGIGTVISSISSFQFYFDDFANDKILPDVDYKINWHYKSGTLKVLDISKNSIKLDFKNLTLEQSADIADKKLITINGVTSIPWKITK